MTAVNAKAANEPIISLNRAFMLDFPLDAARRIETMTVQEAGESLQDQPAHVVSSVLNRLAPGLADAVLMNLPDKMAVLVLNKMETGAAVALLARLDAGHRDHFLAFMADSVAGEFRELLTYPEGTAGRLMDAHIIAFNEGTTVSQAITQMKKKKVKKLRHLFLLTDDMRLSRQVDIQRIALAEGDEKLSTLSLPLTTFVQALDPKEEVVQQLMKHRVNRIPVVDIDHHLVGIIEGHGMIDAMREDVTADMQTMVGVSKDERALSSSWFAVKKRLPWLQINLLTAFLAAAVVGMFEATIAKYTALAILLPIAAGQSGNTGAQALAVTMRGLTLREITVKHWLRVTLKEAGAALINGLAIAVTCGAGIYLWSRSVGLALIIALAMVSSMIIAAVSGALVPIILKRLGQDPALSSSIILTTVTDIAGFMSFLGIATMLSGMLEAG